MGFLDRGLGYTLTPDNLLVCELLDGDHIRNQGSIRPSILWP